MTILNYWVLVQQNMQCEHIVSCVPYDVKAKAVKDTLYNKTTNMIPATILKTHKNYVMYLDADSASMLKADSFVR